MSIGEVLSALRGDFPDVTISKIRFLESEGLVEPQRSAAGYRKFSHEDVERLRYVLAAQREHYLPLRVIKEHLEAIDRGLEPAPLPGTGPRVPRVVPSGDGFPAAATFGRDRTDLRLSREELAEAAEIEPELLDVVESYGLVTRRAGSPHYDGDALVVAKAVAELAAFGLEPRHLRAFKSAAEREAGLVEAVLAPLVKQRNPEGRARADEVARELGALSVRLHAALVKAALRAYLGH
jgi:DNA-binding transcriptional MerR regulator